MLITELQGEREGQAWRLRGQAAIKQRERDREIVHQDFLRAGFIRLIEMFGVSRSSWYGHCSCHFTTANRFLFAGRLAEWHKIGLVTRQPQPRTCHKHFHARVEGHRSMSSWLERILLYWIYIWFWLLFLFQVSFVDLWIISSMCQL